MALARVQYTGDGATTTYSIPFPYLYRADVQIKVDGVEVDFTFVSDSTISLDVAAPNGSIVDIKRETEREDILVDFQDASTLTETELDLAARQSFYLAQEAFDQTGSTMAVAEDGSFSAGGRRISLLGDPNSDDDAATQAYVKSQLAGGFDAHDEALAAAASADAAATDATAASGSATAASTSETNAAASASAASTSETNAAASASAAATSETNAANSEAGVQADADAAASSAASASTSASNASTSANAAQVASSNAATSETNAANSASSASSSASAAQSAQTAADSARTDAQSARDTAKVYRDEAATSKAAAATSEANAASTLDEFQDSYWGAFASEQATSPVGNAATEGDLYFNTTEKKMKVFNGTNWIDAGSSLSTFYDRRNYTATAGQTAFSVDYDVPFIQVFINGDLLPPSDYTATNGTSIVLNSGVPVDTEVTCVGLGAFQVADALGASANLSDVPDPAAARGSLNTPSLAGGADADFTSMPFVGSAPVIESGSNGNGSYVKFADGTLLCRVKKTTASYATSAGGLTPVSSGVDWTFPVAFVGEPFVTFSRTSSWVYDYTAGYEAVSSTSVYNWYVKHISGSSHTTAHEFFIKAEGRWK